MRLKARVHALPISGKCPFLSARFLALTILAGARKALCGGLFGKKTAGAQLAVFLKEAAPRCATRSGNLAS
ncbi:hypothetical protein [Paenibacillus sp. Y412MC10]|uniref:hypothetical protein n=1 Tax=Geobacillus sp. (strain Y412MC10) TaxID=481743 RepID=UPI0011A87142|nr:hypothetical protein [Paenibacillus sp. Y412MC10]